MIAKNEVTDVVLGIIKGICQEMELEMDVNEELVIIGEDSGFDSMAFLDLIAGIEEWMDDNFELYVSLAGDEEDFDADGPFGSVKRLAEYVTEVINREMVTQ